jgi:hypothetical protein
MGRASTCAPIGGDSGRTENRPDRRRHHPAARGQCANLDGQDREPRQLGNEIWVIIDLRVQFGKIESVARRVADAPEVYFVGIMTGSRDLLVGAVFKSNADPAG